jgi:hypothetical protein
VNVLIGGEARVDLHALHVIRRVGGNLLRVRWLGGDVGLALQPRRVGRDKQRRRVGFLQGLAARRAAVDPRDEQVPLSLGQSRVVLETAVPGHRRPRRHVARQHLLTNRRGPGAGLVVGGEGHRHVVRRVTREAAPLQDRRNILGPQQRGGDPRMRPDRA